MINTCPANQTRETGAGQPTAVVEWQLPNATDNSAEAMSVSCSPESGSNLDIGQHQVVCSAEDSSGNKAMCHFYVNITGM